MLSPRNLIIIGLAIVAQNQFGGGFKGITQLQAQGEENRALRTSQQQETTRLQLSQDLAKQKDPIARQRYQNGCLMVVSSKDRSQLTAITEGKPVMDSARNVPLSVGNIVCDSNGLTGEIITGSDSKTPIVGNTAFTSDRALVAQAVKRYRGTRYTMPKQ
jgi:hypothetical protein